MKKNSSADSNFRADLRANLVSGFLVFLIALPLCLGISLASGYPAVAGIFTAIIGGILTSVLSNSELTIKGPAAGLIVIVLGCVTDFGFTGGKDLLADFAAYRQALGVGVAAGVVQILFGVLRVGILGEIFPLAAVHGMLASIGVIIILKQIPVALGAVAKGSPIELATQLPHSFYTANPEIATIGAVSLAILFALPRIRNPYVRRIPGPMLVLAVAVPLGLWFDLSHEHTYTMLHGNYNLGQSFLVKVPGHVLSAVTLPDFSGLAKPFAWKWVVMFSLIGSLESLLSAKAVDLLDPLKRKTNLDRDLLAVGIANTVAALVGGLPMISEIVRSRANIDNGAKSRYSDMFHGIFLLLALLLIPAAIHRIPLAALAAMLVFTGFRLASPKEFMHMYEKGKEQLAIFVGTIVAVLATDLLVGILIGVAINAMFHLLHGMPWISLFRIDIEVRDESPNIVLKPRRAAVFANWISIKRVVERALKTRRSVVVDFSDAAFVDETVMEKLHEMAREFTDAGLQLLVRGLDQHQGLSSHPLATKKKVISRG